MPENLDLKSAVTQGINYLRAQQLPDGSFFSYSSPSIAPFRPIRQWRTNFVPALMLNALATIPEAADIASRLADFLLRQQETNGAYNYWTIGTPERQTMPYPHDLDDTFCALSGLALYKPELIDGKKLAQAVRLLLAAESAPGGPYRTWLVSPDSQDVWLDIDPLVNSNIEFFLTLAADRLPSLDDYLSQVIAGGCFTSPYYPTAFPGLYYLARAYRGPREADLLSHIRRYQRTAKLTALDTALCLTARFRLGDNIDQAIRVAALGHAQQDDGSWPAAVFFADPHENNRRYYHGSACLSTAFALEALCLLSETARAAPRVLPAANRHEVTNGTPAALLARAEVECANLAPDVRRTFLHLLAKMANGSNGSEIISLPYRFGSDFLPQTNEQPQPDIDALALANLYGWLAYTIYDDIMDDSRLPRRLPVANIAMRKALQSFKQFLPECRPFQKLVQRTFDDIDGANAWELSHCRFKRLANDIVIDELPNYRSLQPLANRSLGHGLAPLALGLSRGLNLHGSDLQHLRRSLNHYLIVRQLNDDLHDWTDDLRGGRITYVVTEILVGLETAPSRQPLAKLLEAGRQEFWLNTLPRVCHIMQRHVSAAQRAARAVESLRPNNVLIELLDKQSTAIDELVSEHYQTKKFLKYYSE